MQVLFAVHVIGHGGGEYEVKELRVKVSQFSGETNRARLRRPR